MASYRNYNNITADDILLVLTYTGSNCGVNNHTSGNVGVEWYKITGYNSSSGLLNYDVNYNASWGNVWYAFDIYSLK